MSHLTAKPLAELHQLATDLENLAFSKAQGNQASQLLQSSTSTGSQVAPYLTSALCVQEQYVNILSKRMKKLEAQQSGLATQQPSSVPHVLQPQDLAQQQHLRLQQQQQQAQQQQLLHQRQQQQMLLQRSQQQIQHQRAQSVQAQQQAMASSAGSHDDDQFAQMSDVFGLYNSAPSASASSQQPVNQAYMHAQSQAQAQKLQQQHKQQAAQMPQIPGQLSDQLKQATDSLSVASDAHTHHASHQFHHMSRLICPCMCLFRPATPSREWLSLRRQIVSTPGTVSC